MKLFEYGHYFVVFADGNQYEIDGNMGHKNAPWSKVSAQKIYIAKIDNGNITAANTADPTQTFSGKITKYGRWNQELYNMVERTVLLEALKKYN
jgi:hypothetical protein